MTTVTLNAQYKDLYRRTLENPLGCGEVKRCQARNVCVTSMTNFLTKFPISIICLSIQVQIVQQILYFQAFSKLITSLPSDFVYTSNKPHANSYFQSSYDEVEINFIYSHSMDFFYYFGADCSTPLNILTCFRIFTV